MGELTQSGTEIVRERAELLRERAEAAERAQCRRCTTHWTGCGPPLGGGRGVGGAGAPAPPLEVSCLEVAVLAPLWSGDRF